MDGKKMKRLKCEGQDVNLLLGSLNVTRRCRSRVGGAHIAGRDRGRKALTRRAMSGGMTGRRLAMMMGHGLGGQIALVHALGTVLARSAAVFVDALGFALATAHAGAAGSEGGRPHNAGRHGAVVCM